MHGDKSRHSGCAEVRVLAAGGQAQNILLSLRPASVRG
ncbi:hypothetical protein ASZ90_011124 [hydrocarbon metagenome]|uniref:Uncharacterized protein n=1 Tax=hydrocarbon metagenome TaxID=938273 RepID=A0A0W8FE58_9ZZZZ